MFYYFLSFLLLLFPFFDVHYFFRTILLLTVDSLRKKKHILDECIYKGICLTTDLDYMFHMNNARYVRECDFARFDFWIRTSAWKFIKSLGGSLTNGGNNIRYRRSIQLFDRYNIHTKIVYWDEKSIYMEQKFVRISDQFVCAISIVKQTLIGVSPDQILLKMDPNIVKPEPLPEVVKYIESCQLSSERLRKSL